MFETNPTIYAILFSLAIVLTYLTVRNGWLRLPIAIAAGVSYTSFSFFLFALARGTGLFQAIVVGLALGTAFTIASAISAAIFRIQALESKTKGVKQSASASRMSDEEPTLSA